MATAADALPPTALVFDFETDAMDGAPVDQAPIQVAGQVIQIGPGLRTLEEHSFNILIKGQTTEIGPYHFGLRRLMAVKYGVDVDECEQDDVLAWSKDRAKQSDEYKNASRGEKSKITRMIGEKTNLEDRFTLEQINRDGVELAEAARRIMSIVVRANVKVMVAHNGEGMDFPHLKRAVLLLEDDELLARYEALETRDTMLQAQCRHPFFARCSESLSLSEPRRKARRSPATDDSYPHQLTVTAARGACGEPVRFRVVFSARDAARAQELAGGGGWPNWCLRLHDDTGDADDLGVFYDADAQPKLFFFELGGACDEGCDIVLYSDMRYENPVLAPRDVDKTFADASACFVSAYTAKYPKQDELLKKFGLTNPDAHDGAADVEALCKLLRTDVWDCETLRCRPLALQQTILPDVDVGDRVAFLYGTDTVQVVGRLLGWVPNGPSSWGARVDVGGERRYFSHQKIRCLARVD